MCVCQEGVLKSLATDGADVRGGGRGSVWLNTRAIKREAKVDGGLENRSKLHSGVSAAWLKQSVFAALLKTFILSVFLNYSHIMVAIIPVKCLGRIDQSAWVSGAFACGICTKTLPGNTKAIASIQLSRTTTMHWWSKRSLLSPIHQPCSLINLL